MPERRVGVEKGVSGSLHRWTRPERSQGSSREDQSREEPWKCTIHLRGLGQDRGICECPPNQDMPRVALSNSMGNRRRNSTWKGARFAKVGQLCETVTMGTGGGHPIG